MTLSLTELSPRARHVFNFRPWVRRAGLSIVLITALSSALIIVAIVARPTWRFGWIGEPFVWLYLGTLWLGGARVFTGTMRPMAEVEGEAIVMRPLHQFLTKRVLWSSVRGTEQLMGGDRLILYYDTPRGMRFVALNLNLVKGRRDFLALLDERLRAMGFVEKTVERSRYLSRP
jgi:hypothetical protein